MLIARTSTVRCDICQKAEIMLQHDISLECDAGYPFNKALGEAGWDDRWIKRQQRYCHVCPDCQKKT